MTTTTQTYAGPAAVPLEHAASVSGATAARQDTLLAQEQSAPPPAAGGAEPLPNLIDLLDQLAEPAAPPPVPLTPQTWGWAVLAALAAALVIWLIARAVRHYHANAYRRAALAELEACGNDPAKVAAILRRAALAAWPRDRVASLTGDAWVRFLHETGGFAEEQGAVLRAAPWEPDPAPAPALRRAAEQWVRHHRVSRASAAEVAS
jgi:hypothetical protein